MSQKYTFQSHFNIPDLLPQEENHFMEEASNKNYFEDSKKKNSVEDPKVEPKSYFKLYLFVEKSTEIRRVPLMQSLNFLTFKELTDICSKKVDEKIFEERKIGTIPVKESNFIYRYCYKDNENEWISMDTEEEWEDCKNIFQEIKGKSILKIQTKVLIVKNPNLKKEQKVVENEEKKVKQENKPVPEKPFQFFSDNSKQSFVPKQQNQSPFQKSQQMPQNRPPFQNQPPHQIDYQQPQVPKNQPPSQQNQMPFQQSQLPFQQNQPPFQQNQPPFQQNQPPFQQNQPPFQQNQMQFQNQQSSSFQNQQHQQYPPQSQSQNGKSMVMQNEFMNLSMDQKNYYKFHQQEINQLRGIIDDKVPLSVLLEIFAKNKGNIQACFEDPNMQKLLK